MEKSEIDPELFDMLNNGLQKIFKENTRRNLSDYASENNTSGIAAAEAAQALIDLHKNFKPKV